MSNPTESEIEAALWQHMAGLAPTWTTKLPGIDLKPGNQAYQRGTWLPGARERVAIGAGSYFRQVGVYQIDLFYPKSEKRTDFLFARATAMRQRFYPDDARGLAIDAGGGQIIVDRATVSRLDESDAVHNRVWLDVFVRIELPPAA